MERDILKQKILQKLQLGKNNAILGRNLAFITDSDPRFMRECIKELRHEGHLIGNSVGKPAGYYFIETAEELIENMNRARSYCIENALMRRDLKKAGRHLLEKHEEKETGQVNFLHLCINSRIG